MPPKNIHLNIIPLSLGPSATIRRKYTLLHHFHASAPTKKVKVATKTNPLPGDATVHEDHVVHDGYVQSRGQQPGADGDGPEEERVLPQPHALGFEATTLLKHLGKEGSLRVDELPGEEEKVPCHGFVPEALGVEAVQDNDRAEDADEHQDPVDCEI
ncbi:hypothetical protein ACJZ2D_000297 [Fusarium nematophilum]